MSDPPAASIPAVPDPSICETIDGWLLLASERVHAASDLLTRLDQAIGDGDHGTNLDRGFAALVGIIKAGPPAGEGTAAAAERLRQAGRALISNVGGAAGPLYGTGLLRAAAAIASSEPGASDGVLLVVGLEAAVGGVAALGKATTGEKTMLDALVPAAEAGRAALSAGREARDIARAAAEAAAEGALRTVPLLATKGRASYLGERSIGHQDPGATSAALIVRALADALADALAP